MSDLDDLHIDGPRLDPKRLREIIKEKTFRYDEAFLFPGTWLDLLKANEAQAKELAEARAERDRLNTAYCQAVNEATQQKVERSHVERRFVEERVIAGKAHEADAKAFLAANSRAEAAEKEVERLQEDADRWNALLRCARIRMQGSAGFDPETGERREYKNATGEYEPSSDGWVHFGAEFWSVYPGHEDEDPARRWGTVALKALADDVLLKERAALGERP